MPREYERTPLEHLFASRTLYLSGEITSATTDAVVSRLLVLDAIDRNAAIKLYVSSPGGGIYAGLGIYDALQLVEAPVWTIGVGSVASMAAWIVAAGEPGHRYATPNTHLMIHQGSAQHSGSTADLAIAAEHMREVERDMVDILAAHIGRSREEICRRIERNHWLSAEEAVEFGLIDAVVPASARKAAALAGNRARAGLDVIPADGGSHLAASSLEALLYGAVASESVKKHETP